MSNEEKSARINGQINDKRNELSVVPVYFNAAEMGETLEEISYDVVKADSEHIISRWFHSERDVDLYVWSDEAKNIIKQQVNFCGQLIEWNILDGVRTGVICEQELEGQEKPKESVHFDRSPIDTAIRQALQLLKHARKLTETERLIMIRNFSESPTLGKMQNGEFFERFGDKALGHKPKTLWRKIRNWLKAS